MSEVVDCRGVTRGKCSLCGCDGYDGGTVGKKCLGCCHPPGKHKNMDAPAIPFQQEPLQPPVSPTPSSQSCVSLAESISPLSLKQENGGEDSLLDCDTSLWECGPPSSIQSPMSLPDSECCFFPKCFRPRYKEKDKTHHFCGKRHAKEFQNIFKNVEVGTDEICSTPGCTKFKFRNGDGKVFDFCSIYCRDNQPKEGLAVLPLEERGRCILPDCTEYKYQDPANGRIHPFCSRTHGSEAKARGIKIPESDSSISLVDMTTQEGITVSQTFVRTWAQRKGNCPSISFIFSVTNTYLKQTWYTYKNALKEQSVEEYFHGTKLECDITTQCSLCSNKDCGICGIINIGFDRRCIQRNINFQRFGHGFYVAPNSSKCHDYTQGKHGYRAMILFDVCPGKKYELKRDDETLKEPPSDCNSVHGKSGQSLNFDELVLYNPDGAFPKYVIVYKHAGEHKIAQ